MLSKSDTLPTLDANSGKMANGTIRLANIQPRLLYLGLLALLVIVILLLLPHNRVSERKTISGLPGASTQEIEMYSYDATYPLTKPVGELSLFVTVLVRVRMCVRAYVCVHASSCVSVHACACVRACVHAHVCLCVCVSVLCSSTDSSVNRVVCGVMVDHAVYQKYWYTHEQLGTSLTSY